MKFDSARKSVHAKKYNNISKRAITSKGVKYQIETGTSYKWQHFFRRFFVTFLIILLTISMLGAVSLIGVVNAYSKRLPADVEGEINKAQDEFLETIIVDRNMKELYRLRGDRIKENVKLTEVPQKLQWAFLAAEDAQFYEHKGLNLLGTTRALICNFQKNNISDCGGGSSVTQQLVKITTGKNQKSYERKIEEAILAMQIEKTHSKDEILERYLNAVPQGGILEGVKAGSKYLFGKPDLNSLTLAEMALMASIANEPTTLSPWGGSRYNIERSIDRANYVLDRMLEVKQLSGVTPQDIAQAKTEVPTVKFASRDLPMLAPHFVDYVVKELDKMYANKRGINGAGANYLRDKGFTIVTTADYNTQNLLEQTLKERVSSADFQKWIGAQNAAGVVMDPKTGEITAMVGSRDFYGQADPNDQRFKPQDNAALSERSLGSTLKPALYLTAFRMGYDPLTLLPDQKLDLRESGATDPYIVKNYSRKYGEYGNPITIRNALRNSLNVPAVTMHHIVGREAYIDTYYKLNGWRGVADAIKYPSSTLGAANMPLLEQVHAYATMASEGMYFPKKSILEIRDRAGNIIFNNRESKGKQVIDKKYMYLINDLNKHYWLFDVDRLLLKIKQNTDIAGKTGTGDNGDGSTSDVAFMAYTPETVVGMWAGNSCGANACPLSGIEPHGEHLYKYLFSQFLEKYSESFKPARFSAPTGVKKIDGCAKFEKGENEGELRCVSGEGDWAPLPPYDTYLGEKKDIGKLIGTFQSRPVKEENDSRR